jgi:DNA-directed RNA polymerase specialized sigma24 family protein
MRVMTVKGVSVGASPSGREARDRFELLYGELFAPISGYVVRRVGNPEDAAEVIAETFATLWRRLDSCPAGEEARPWLFGVARRVVANQRRGERRRGALGERLAAECDVAIASPPGVGVDGQIAGAFARLSEPDREVLSLVAWEGLAGEDLAVVLGVSRPVVRLRLHRARRRFKSALERERQARPVGARPSMRLSQGGEEHECA